MRSVRSSSSSSSRQHAQHSIGTLMVERLRHLMVERLRPAAMCRARPRQSFGSLSQTRSRRSPIAPLSRCRKFHTRTRHAVSASFAIRHILGTGLTRPLDVRIRHKAQLVPPPPPTPHPPPCKVTLSGNGAENSAAEDSPFSRLKRIEGRLVTFKKKGDHLQLTLKYQHRDTAVNVPIEQATP